MRKRLAGTLISLVAVLALSGLAAGAASAKPALEFKVKGTAIGANVKFPFIDSSGESRLYVDTTPPLVIVCKKDTSAGIMQANGRTLGIVEFDECKVFEVGPPEKELAGCVVTNVQAFFVDHLAYEVGTEHIVDVFETPHKIAAEPFAEIKIAGSTCSLKGTHPVTGSEVAENAAKEKFLGQGVIAKVSPERTEEETGNTTFKATSFSTQELKEYEEPVTGEVIKKVNLKFSGTETALNSADTITLASKEIWGAF